MNRVLFVLLLFIVTKEGFAADSLEVRLAKYCEAAEGIAKACQYDFALSVQFEESGKDPLFIEMLGRISRKHDAFLLRFDQRRRQERGSLLLTYESGLRTPDAIKSAFGVTSPKPEVRDVPEETRRKNQFEENFYSLNPMYFPVRSFLQLRIGDPFAKDDLMALMVIDQSTLADGREKFVYSPVLLGGGLVYEMTFSNDAAWLPVEFRRYVHPLVSNGELDKFKAQLSEVDPADYKDWVRQSTTMTNWQKVGNVHVPAVVRMVRYKQGDSDASDSVFTFRNWKFSNHELDEAFAVSKFTSDNLPGEEFFNQIESDFAKDLEDSAAKR